MRNRSRQANPNHMKWGPLAIAAIYLLLGEVWILVSDTIAAIIAPNEDVLSQIDKVKGGGYFIVSAILLYWLISLYASSIQESNERYRLLAENSYDVIWLLDPFEGKFTYISPSVLKLRGYTAEEVMAQPLEQAFLPGEFERETKLSRERLALFQAKGSGTVSYIDELAQPHKDGSIVYTEVTTTYLFNNQKKIEIMGVTRDITRRKQAEINHRASEKKYQELLDQASDGIFIADPSGRYTLVNEQACRLVGFTKEELLSMNLRDLVAPEDMQDTPLRLDELRAGKVLITERKLVCKDESRIVCEISSKTLPDGSFQSIVRDITERKVTEDALVRSEKRYRSLFENMSNGYARCQVLYDEQGKPFDFLYTDVNKSFRRLTGLQNVIGRRVSEVIPGIHESNPELLAAYARVAATGQSESFETFVPGLGSGIWFSVSAYSFEQGFFIAVFEAITERKQAEESLQRSYFQLLSFIEQAPLSIVMLDRSMNYLAASRRWVIEYGRGYNDLIGRNHYDIQPDIPDYWKESHQKGLAGETVKNDDDLWVQADGTKHWLKWAVTPWRDIDGKVGGIIISSEDISERKRAEVAAFKSERRYHRVLDAMMEGCQIIDFNWRYVYVNGVVADQGKYKPEDLLNHTMMEKYPGIEKTELFGILSRCMEHRTSQRFENQFHFQDGSIGWFELSIQPAEEGIFILSTDISNRKRAEFMLLESHAELEERIRERTAELTAANIQLEKSLVETRLLYLLSRTLAEFETLEDAIQKTADLLADTLRFDRLNIITFDTEKESVVNFYKGGPGEDDVVDVSHEELQEGLSGWVLQTHQSALSPKGIPDPRESPAVQKRRIATECGAIIVVPILFQNRVLGTITAINRPEQRDFNQSDLELLESISLQIAVLIENSRLYSSMRQEVQWRQRLQLDLEKANLEQEVRIQQRTAELAEKNLALQQEINDRKQAEEQVLYQANLLMNISEAIIATDEKQFITSWNHAAEEMYGWKEQEVKGKLVRDLVRSEFSDAQRQDAIKAMAETGHFKSEVLQYRRNGQPLWVEGNTIALHDSSGRITGFVSVNRDITERKQAEQKLARQNQRLKVLREIDTAILAADSVERIVGAALDHIRELIECERANLALIEWEKNEAVNFDVRDSKESAISKGARVSLDLIQDILQVLSRNQPVTIDDLTALPDPPPQIKIFIKEGLRSRCILPLFSQGNLFGSLTLSSKTTGFFDEEKINLGREVGNQMAIAITQSNLLSDLQVLNDDLEARVIERTTQLEAANKELESFSYSVSHDLRAPLRAIDGYTNILLEEYATILDEEGKRLCGVISRETKRMGKLIDNLLSFSRMGRREMHFQNVDMKTLVDSVIDELLKQQDRNRIDLQVTDMPSVKGDSALMRQVWINLLSNAIKFTSRRERALIQVKASQTEEEIIYSVQDNGAGFEMEYVNKLFGVFQRLHTDSEFEGTGVGLAIVQKVIHRHGGRIWAEGKVGEGATFHFALPRRLAES